MKLSKSRIFLLISALVISTVSCSQNSPQTQEIENKTEVKTPSTVSEEIPIWGKTIPNFELIKGTETYNAGMIENVSKPTIKIFSPKENNTGVAILVFPGGGYNKLAIDLEGSEICEWLASIGVTGILLKYRVPASGHHYDKDCKCGKDPIKPLALQDAQRAMSLVRFRAKEWNINPDKIGVMGFSAGGHLVTDVSTNYRKRAYSITDEVDTVNCRPDFGLSFFPGSYDRSYKASIRPE